MKPFRDWPVRIQLLLSGTLPVFLSVSIVGFCFFGGLYELKKDAVAAQYIIHDIRSSSYYFTSKLRELLIDVTEKRDHAHIREEVTRIRQRVSRQMEAYAIIAHEGEAANTDMLADLMRSFKALESMFDQMVGPGSGTSPVDVALFDMDIKRLEEEIFPVFDQMSDLVEREVEREMMLLSLLVIVASLICLSGSVFFIRVVSKKIVNRIETLKTASKNFGVGDLNQRVVMDSANEFGELGGAFNKMADDLQNSLDSLAVEIERRKASEDELKNSHLELERRVKQRTDELQSTYQQLAHAGRLAALGEMATGLAHEIRQPLAVMDLACLSLKRYIDNPSNNPDQALSSISKIKEQIQRADKIIDQMRGFARTEGAEQKMVDLRKPVEIAASFFREQFKLNHIDFRMETEAQIPPVCAEEQKIEQLVVNLLSNAKYAVLADSRDEATKQSKWIWIHLFHDAVANHVVIAVSDNGCGMDSEEREKCLNPFFTTKPVGEGTGLGLSIAYNIVQELRGRIDIESEKGMGSKFIIHIPSGGRENEC